MSLKYIKKKSIVEYCAENKMSISQEALNELDKKIIKTIGNGNARALANQRKRISAFDLD